MPKDQANKPEKDRDIRYDGSDSLDTTAQKIVETFAKKKQLDSPSYFKIKNKEHIIKEFKDFVKERYGEWVLVELLKSDQLDAEFNQLANRWFTVSDFLDNTKNTVIKEQFNTISEKEALSNITLDCYKQRNNLSSAEKNTMKFDDFLDEIWYNTKTDPNGHIIQSISVPPRAKITTVAGLKKSWDRFVSHHTSNTVLAESYRDMMDISHFDPSEKIACVTATQSLYNKLDKLTWSKRDKILEIREDHFGPWVNDMPVSALLAWTTLDGLQSCMQRFFDDIISRWLVTEDQLKDLKSLSIDTKTCMRYGKKSGELTSEDVASQGKKFSQLSRTIQSLSDKLVTADFVNNVERNVEKLDTSIENFSKVFDMPGSMKWFFDQFPQNTARDRIPSHKKKEAGALKAQEELLSNQAEQARIKGDRDTMKSLEKEIIAVRKKRHDLQTSDPEVKIGMNTYFESIAHTTASNLEILWKSPDPQLISDIQTILHKLHVAQWKSSALSLSEQNILMKVSVLAQLAKVKQSDILTDLNHNFDEYAQFVSGLFDFNSKQSIITTKDHYPIEINFSSKKMVWEPYNRETISLDNLTDLSKIHIEFEVDLNNDKEWQTELFIRQITGGKNSQIVRDLPFSWPNFPKTISDSTFVELIGKDGKPYRWYLSPACLSVPGWEHTDEYDEYGNITPAAAKRAETYANTFVLYDKPVDQYCPDRKVMTYGWAHEDDNHEPKNPIYINADNAKDFQSLEVKDKKLTLSDKYINSLALGHVLAQEHNLDRISLNQFDDKFTDLTNRLETSQDSRQMGEQWHSTDDAHSEKVAENNDDYKKLVEWWKKLFSDTPKEKIPPTIMEGQRFAFNPKKPIGPKSIPANREYLSATIVSTKEENGKIVSFELEVENLTIGVPSLTKRKRTVNSTNIDMFSSEDIFNSSRTKYLGNRKEIKSDDISRIRSDLSDNFPKKWNPDFLRAPLWELTFTNGKFQKWGKDIVKFIAPHQASSWEKWDKKKYDVEYTIKKSGDLYHISSSPYAIDKLNKDWSPEKDNSWNTIQEKSVFEATTDLTGLMMIIANKKLLAYTKDQEEAGIENNVIPTTRPKTWRSVWRVRDFVSGEGKHIVEAWKKKREETSKADFEYMMFNEYNIYRRLEHKFWGVLEYFDMNFLDDMADHKETEGLEYGWKKIKADFDHIEKFHHGYNVNLMGEGESKHKWGNAMCEERMDKAMESYNHNNGNVPYKQRYRAAAALMYMLKTYKNGTARLMQRYPRGSYVKILFWAAAYKVFVEKYEAKKAELENSKYWSKIQQDLVLLEYNFICNNIAGWGQQDERVRDQDINDDKGWWDASKNPNAWYFQRLYSREYGKQLRTHIGAIKQIDPSPSSEGVKKMVDWNTFGHIKSEYYSHISQYRMEDAVQELVAMQQLAATQEEANEVFVAMMLGILNGALIHNLWAETRDKLRRTCRNSGIPFPNRMEHHDAQKKIQRLLNLCTADMGKDSFAQFTYDRKDSKTGKVLEPGITYDPLKFEPLKREEGDTFWLKDSFTKRLAPNTKARERVINFLTMDNIDEEDNNMIRIRKSNDDHLPEIYWRKIEQEDKDIIDSMMWEFYFNKDRWQDLPELNWNYWYDWNISGHIGYKGWAHVRTMIEPAFKLFNKFDHNGSFELWVWDHAEWIWTSILRRIPSSTQPLPATSKYRLSYHVDEFFRIFSGVWGIKYSKDMIEKFYKHINIIRYQSDLDEKDKIRLIWFYLVEQAYEGWSIPPVIEKALKWYLSFFETNIHLFDQEMASMHRHPGAGAEKNKNFGQIFAHKHENEVYIPDKERKTQEPNQRLKKYNDEGRNGTTIINWEMEEANGKLSGRRRWGHHPIGKDVDELIEELRWTSHHWSSGHHHNEHISAVQSRIHATNNDLVNRWDLEKSSLSVDKNGKLVNTNTKPWVNKNTTTSLKPWWDIASPWWIPKERIEAAEKAWAKAWGEKAEETVFSMTD
jgi:hypothetical protein